MKYLIRTVWILLLFLAFIAMDLSREAHAAERKFDLGFTPLDTMMDSERSTIYMTRVDSKEIYAVNYKTGEIQTLTLPYTAERLDIYQNHLYVTQPKIAHDKYNFGPYEGAIAVVNLDNLTFNHLIDVDADPYDIAVDQDGFIYITPGSGQHNNMKVYDLSTETEVYNSQAEAIMSERSVIYYNVVDSKLYTIPSTVRPVGITSFKIEKGKILDIYSSLYTGDYKLNKTAQISPDGLRLYNSGVAFNIEATAPNLFKEKYVFDQAYSYFAFSKKDQLTFAAGATGGIDVYKYDTNKYLYTLQNGVVANQLFYQNGLMMIRDHTLTVNSNIQAETLRIFTQQYRNGYDRKNKPVMNDLKTSMTKFPTDTAFEVLFNQHINVKDTSEIKLTGPEGPVPIKITSDNGLLSIAPTQRLQDASNYTLTISNSALTGYKGEQLAKSLKFQLKTIIPEIEKLTLQIDDKKVPGKYFFTAQATGGYKPQYLYYVVEGDAGTGPVLQKFSNTSSYTWQPSHNGLYTMIVRAKSTGADVGSEKVSRYNVLVDDHEIPTATFKVNKKTWTNQDVKIDITAKDNGGIDYIAYPEYGIKYDSQMTFTAIENGTYTFQVFDYVGNVFERSVKVSNIDKVKPKITLKVSTTAPTKNSVILTAQVTDKNGIKRIKLPNGKYVQTAKTTYKVNENGKYTFIVEDVAGNQMTKSITVKSIDRKAPAVPKINKITTKTKQITGKAEKAATVYIYNGSKYVKKGTVDSKGNVSITIPKQKKDRILSFYAVDKAKNKSKIAKVQVK
ncbi:Ig-like domain-containing protein [Peribacillus simplex]|uniref:Ig-like domain-containing protein n=1 Tax=Peribacillus simplex TaxID=1478 RepID=UPI003CFD4D7E